MGTRKFDDQFRLAVADVVNAARRLSNVEVAERSLPLAARNHWLSGEIEKLDEVATSILKHLNEQ